MQTLTGCWIFLPHTFLLDCRELKETTVNQVPKETEVAQVTLVLKVPLVSPVSK